MTVLAAVLTIVIAAGAVAGLLPAAFPSGEAGAPAGNAALIACAVALVGFAALSFAFPRSRVNWRLPASGVLGFAGLAILLHSIRVAESPAGFWGLVLSVWAIGWIFVERLSALEPGAAMQRLLLTLAVPAVFGAWILFLWEVPGAGPGCSERPVAGTERHRKRVSRLPRTFSGPISSRPS